jgi:PAS domain S-box-containing protein
MLKGKLPEVLLKSLEIYPAGVFVLNTAGLIFYVNELGTSLVGSKNENLINKSFLELIDKKGKSDFQEFLQKVFASSESSRTNLRIKGVDEEFFEALLIAKYFEFSHSTVPLCLLTVIDLTSLVINEEIGRQSELRFERMANTAPVMLWIADVDGLFSFVNKVWLDYTGEKIGAQLGMNWLKTVHPDDYEKLLTVYKNAFLSREHFSAEFRFRRMNGEFQWMLINGSPRVNDQGIFTGYIGSCININEQIKNEEKIKEINTELTESNKTKDKFFSIISHDLRGPLSGLMQLLDILADEYSTLKEQEKIKLISEAATSANRTYNLMENLLEWSRVQSGKMEYQPERVNLLQLVNDVISLYNQNIKHKNISLEINIQNNISVFTDQKIIETVLRNLIANAIKFTYPNGAILITAEKNDDFVIIKIRDTGVGISEENLPNLFRLDISHSTKGTENESGTGLGLILCKELVERQGGKIWIESKINEGSDFYFTIPLAL